MYGYTNDAGEPIMSGEAWRTEQALDAAQPPYEPDDYLADAEDDEDDEDMTDEVPDSCLNRVDGHWYVVTYGRAPYTIHAENCATCAAEREDPPAVPYTCGACDEEFPPGVTGHTDDNPCGG